MNQSTRVRPLNDHPVGAGQYVLYWMQQSQRTRFNHALEYAIDRANQLRQPLLVGFGLMDDYPEANERHYAFMLEGIRDVAMALKDRGIRFVIHRGNPAAVAIGLAGRASVVVCDRGYLRHQRHWRETVARSVTCEVVQVESDVVVPIDVASDKQEFAARTIRPRLHRHWEEYLVDLPIARLEIPSLHLPIKTELDADDVEGNLAKLKIDRSVGRSRYLLGGERAAGAKLLDFISSKLRGYATDRNEPATGATSQLSPYLHFGQISPVEVALAARRSVAPAADSDAFLEELIIRRELSMNYVQFNAKYDQFEGLPRWAQQTLADHASDARPHRYELARLEAGDTQDPSWNAAQLEMVRTGFMQNYMRMYWGKKVLEWSDTPQRAFADLLYLNNKYFLCGRDANSYVGVGWIFGLHDRPWGPARPIFGTVRYMNAAGLKRKFDTQAYIDKVAALL